MSSNITGKNTWAVEGEFHSAVYRNLLGKECFVIKHWCLEPSKYLCFVKSARRNKKIQYYLDININKCGKREGLMDENEHGTVVTEYFRKLEMFTFMYLLFSEELDICSSASCSRCMFSFLLLFCT